jgi:acetylornithine deacetylase/succinyl-diaminopimelate desuccinylase-like protein
MPRPADNPIYRMSQALEKLRALQFPIKLNEVSRSYFQKSAALQPTQTAADMRAVAAATADAAVVERLAASSPMYNSMMRTTCVATELWAGHAPNALPQMAKVNVNCRIVPTDDIPEVERTLGGLFSSSGAEMSYAEKPKASPPSPLRPEILQTVERLVAKRWPGVPVIPVMETGATDGLYLRNKGIPVYGISALFEDPTDIRAHGRDERIEAQAFYEAVDFWHDMVKDLASK